MQLNDNDRNFFEKIVKDTLFSKLTDTEFPGYYKSKELYNKKIGIFIKILRNNKIRAYGGIMEPDKGLAETIQDLTLKICFYDTRFAPIKPEELDDLTYQFALIDEIDTISDRKLIKPNIHGVLIESQGRRGIILPWDFKNIDMDMDKYVFETAYKAGIDDLENANYTVFKLTTLEPEAKAN